MRPGYSEYRTKRLLVKSLNSSFEPVFTVQPLLKCSLTGEGSQRGLLCSSEPVLEEAEDMFHILV